MKKITMTAVFLFALLYTQGYGAAYANESNEAPGASISIVNAEGQAIGKATLAQKGDKVLIHLEAEKLPPGKHGFHIHQFGKCEAPDFKSAGDHFNPQHKQHGFNNPKGFHEGDLPNIEVGADGKVTADIETAVVTLQPGQPNSIMKEDGVSLVIHEKEDDYATDPSGNSGARIACGVVK
ncbi:superoxide dismutase family protein [Paenibacillus sp. LHD-117]|uniref:superoxide dismutase family protein n=1 Tax=Paenibacillus sp. LHD-117 TaxID=3071412 RepID=UPI0027DEC02E|nr:superoxide dismutase family protein [Paenibacillus sp. LHD-117]MDQ6419642.1 superoxide dismutase family protein [Paenibacillus sp. LHD-117]